MDRTTPHNVKEIKSLHTAFDVVEHLDEVGSCNVTELAAVLDVSKSTVYNHLATLRNRGYVLKSDDDEYRLGLRFTKLGYNVQTRQTLYSVARPEVEDFVDDVGERAQVMVEERGMGVHIYTTEGENAIKTDSNTGTHVYLHTTAAGKSYLSGLSNEAIDEIFDRVGLPALTDATITDRDALLDEIDRVRERGYAFNDEEKRNGLRAVGAPIQRDDTGETLGALSISGPTTRFTGEWYHEDLPQLVREVADVIGIKATYHGP